MTEEKDSTEPIDLEHLYPFLYLVDHNRLCIQENVKGSSEKVNRPLCNFVPFFTAQIIRDEGDRLVTVACLSAITECGKRLPEIQVTSDEFASLGWVTKNWGFACNLEPGSTIRDKVRNALQATSVNAPCKTEYAVTGWKKIDGHWEYLMPGSSDHTVLLNNNKLTGYRMPSSYSQDDLSAVRRLLACEVAPKEILYPLIAFTFLSPLNSFLREAGFDPTAVLFLCGRTGSKKSTLAALMLSFFGRFTSTTLQLSFRDTANSIIHHTYTLKDVLTCIDDYHPTGSHESSKMKDTAQTIMRAYGDRVGRGRLHADSTPMQTRFPQGNAIVTAEFQPDIGESGTARYFLVEMNNGSVNNAALTAAQNDAADGKYAACMFAYISWLKEHFLSDEELVSYWLDELRNVFQQERNAVQRAFAEVGIVPHARIPGAVAVMKIGFIYFLEFLSAHLMLSPEEKATLLSDFDSVIFAIAKQQSGTVQMNNPAYRYLIKINAMLESGRWFVADRMKEVPFHENTQIRYQDNECYYFLPTDSHRMVKKLCEDQGEDFNVSERTLTKLLDEEELTLTDSRSHLKNVRIGKQLKRFIVVRKETMRRVTAMYLNLEDDVVADDAADSVADETKMDADKSEDDLPF